MIAYFADGPLNGQVRDIEFTYRYRVPLITPMKFEPGYWEGSDVLSEGVPNFPSIRIGYYEPSSVYLKSGARIYVFGGIEE